jgi:hypothetical protein
MKGQGEVKPTLPVDMGSAYITEPQKKATKVT